MKKWLIIVFVLFLCGCSFDLMTDENPLGLVDPNQGTAIFVAGQSAANTGQAVGAVTGNPAIIGISLGIGSILTILGKSYLDKRKKK